MNLQNENGEFVTIKELLLKIIDTAAPQRKIQAGDKIVVSFPFVIDRGDGDPVETQLTTNINVGGDDVTEWGPKRMNQNIWRARNER